MVVFDPEVFVCVFVVAPELVTSALTNDDKQTIINTVHNKVRFTFNFFIIIWLAPL